MVDLHKRVLKLKFLSSLHKEVLLDQLPVGRMNPWLKVDRIYTKLLDEDQNRVDECN